MTKFIEDEKPSTFYIEDVETFEFNGEQLLEVIKQDASKKGITGELEDSAVHYAKRAISPLNYAQAKEDLKGFISKRKSLKITSMFSHQKDPDAVHLTELTLKIK